MLADPPGHHGPHRHDDDRRAHQTDEQQRLQLPATEDVGGQVGHRFASMAPTPSAWATNVSISSRTTGSRAPRRTVP